MSKLPEGTLSQSELDTVLQGMKPAEPSKQDKLRAQVREKIRELVTQEYIDAILEGKELPPGSLPSLPPEVYGAISQHELDNLFAQQ
ncbi:MAG: hypothetical protein IJ191_04920 [Treponema sp.]|nr:hypothetical protein [Treponema sp.]